MKKHYENGKTFGKEDRHTPARNEALEGLVKKYREQALRFAARLSGDGEEAQDIVQEAFYRLVRSWNRFDESKSVKAWFFSILHNVAVDTRMRRGRCEVAFDAPVRGKEGVSY